MIENLSSIPHRFATIPYAVQAPRADGQMRFALPFVGVMAFVYFALAATKTSLLGVNSDACTYLLLADHFSPWRVGGRDMAEHLLGTYPFPPAFPFLLGVLGGGTAQVPINYLLGAATLAAGCVLMVLCLVRLGASRAAAFGSCAVFALMPSTVFIAFGVFSEPLYLLVTLAAMCVLGKPTVTPRDWLFGAALVALATLTRSIGITLLGALVVVWFHQTRTHRLRWVPLLAAIPYVSWSVYKYIIGSQSGYAGSLTERGLDVVAALARQAPTNLDALWKLFHRSFDLLGNNYTAIVLIAVFAPASVVLIGRLRRYRIDALYVGLYLLVVVVWPYPNQARRFLFPILPWLIWYAVEGCAMLARQVGAVQHQGGAATLAWILLTTITLPSTASIWLQIAQYRNTEIAEYPKTAQWHGRDSQSQAIADAVLTKQIFEFMRAAESDVPEHACVTSTMPEFVQLYTRRVSVRPPGVDAPEAELLAELERCPYVLLFHVSMFPNLKDPAYYPLQRVHPYLSVLAQAPVHTGSAGDGPLMLLARYSRPGDSRAKR